MYLYKHHLSIQKYLKEVRAFGWNANRNMFLVSSEMLSKQVWTRLLQCQSTQNYCPSLTLYKLPERQTLRSLVFIILWPSSQNLKHISRCKEPCAICRSPSFRLKCSQTKFCTRRLQCDLAQIYRPSQTLYKLAARQTRQGKNLAPLTFAHFQQLLADFPGLKAYILVLGTCRSRSPAEALGFR